MIRHFCYISVWVLARILYRHKIYGKKHLPLGGALIASNHTSYSDPPVLAVSLSERIHFLARETLFRFKPLGWLIRQCDTHPVARGKANTQAFKKTTELLKQGQKVAIFPEGQRSTDGEIKEGLPGIGVLVMRSNAVVVPTYIHGTYSIWPTAKKFPKLWGKTACVFGKPINFSWSLDAPNRKEAQKQVVVQIMDAIKALRDWYLAGAKGSPP